MKQIKVLNPNNLPTIPYKELVPFQEDLKIISNENLEKLARSIIELDFFKAKTVFKLKGKYLLADGHQTRRALEYLETVGIDGETYEIPEIPIEVIEVKSKKEASLKLLAIVSSFGELNEKTSFFTKFNISDKEIGRFSFQTNFKGFGKKFLDSKTIIDDPNPADKVSDIDGYDAITDKALSEISEIGDIEDLANETNANKEADADEDSEPTAAQVPNYIIRYELIFENETQQDVWYKLLKTLKLRYPDLETIGARITQFITDNANE